MTPTEKLDQLRAVLAGLSASEIHSIIRIAQEELELKCRTPTREFRGGAYPVVSEDDVQIVRKRRPTDRRGQWEVRVGRW